jgi:hypothetical protein
LTALALIAYLIRPIRSVVGASVLVAVGAGPGVEVEVGPVGEELGAGEAPTPVGGKAGEPVRASTAELKVEP